MIRKRNDRATKNEPADDRDTGTPPTDEPPRTRGRARDRKRHRASEPWAPRSTDVISPRLAVLSACLGVMRATFEHDGRTWDHATVAAIAEDQRTLETELAKAFAAFRDHYRGFEREHRARESLLRAGIAAIEARGPDREARSGLRMCKQLRPPLAKTAAFVALARERSA